MTAPAHLIDITHSATDHSAANAALPTRVPLNAATNLLSIIAPVTSPANATLWKASIKPSNGTYTGSFIIVDGPGTSNKRTVNFSGVLKQRASTSSAAVIGDGHYLLPAPAGALSNQNVTRELLWQLPQ